MVMSEWSPDDATRGWKPRRRAREREDGANATAQGTFEIPAQSVQPKHYICCAAKVAHLTRPKP